MYFKQFKRGYKSGTKLKFRKFFSARPPYGLSSGFVCMRKWIGRNKSKNRNQTSSVSLDLSDFFASCVNNAYNFSSEYIVTET